MRKYEFYFIYKKEHFKGVFFARNGVFLNGEVLYKAELEEPVRIKKEEIVKYTFLSSKIREFYIGGMEERVNNITLRVIKMVVEEAYNKKMPFRVKMELYKIKRRKKILKRNFKNKKLSQKEYQKVLKELEIKREEILKEFKEGFSLENIEIFYLKECE